MSAEVKKQIQLEIAHVLFIDVVGYSKLSINEQHATVDELTQIVRATEQFQKADAAGRLIKIPTGDGMALVFYASPEAPVRCAMEVSQALKERRRLHIRMGIHSGPVSGVIDVTGRANLAGTGLNMANRVMDCGDAGHILVSKRVAEDLAEDEKWRPFLHDLGICEVKHGAKLHVVNLYSDEFGRRELPAKLQIERRRAVRKRWLVGAAALITISAIIAGALWWSRIRNVPSWGAPEKSIAVLPFENLSEEKQNAYFADGIQDEVLTNLAKIADLKVISRTSVMPYKSGIARNLRQIGQQLGVTHVLEGSVQRADNRVRVNAQLVDARTDRHLWGQSYDRDLADVFAIQSEIAKTIAAQLHAKLSPGEESSIDRPPTRDMTAFDLYTRAKNLVMTATSSADTKSDLLQAAELLNQAVARDPSFLQAYCQLAWTHDVVYAFGYDHTPARLALAEAAVQAAARLRPDAGETHLARAQNLYYGYLDYDGALAELEIARQSLPNDARIFELIGYIHRRRGHWEESTRNLQHALELDPRNVLTLQQTAWTYHYLRRYADERSVWDRVLAILPDDVDAKMARAFIELDSTANTRPLHELINSIRAANPSALSNTASASYWFMCALAERDAAAAKDALIALGENPPYLDFADNISVNRSFAEGLIARMTKDEEKAQSAFIAARAEQEKTVRSQPSYAPALCVLGLIDAALGRKEEALREGRRAVELLPVQKDSMNGMAMIKYLAMIAAWRGDNDLACEQLAVAIHSPSTVSYGQLKLLPFWDPLRGDPRFEKIVASLVPREK
jgi:TolB-like protein/class 3 adenylate cyclase/Tfp pilus assembly protein PilF